MTSVRIAWFILGLVWVIAEIRLTKQSKPIQEAIIDAEHHTQQLLWFSVTGCLILALILKQMAWLPIPMPYLLRQLLAMLVFAAGLGLRYWAVTVLGQFFTTHVIIQEQHQLIISGPYRWVRHPAYTGLLLALFAAGLAMGDFWGLMILFWPAFLAFKSRIDIEEQMLQKVFTNQYLLYSQSSWKLFPWLY